MTLQLCDTAVKDGGQIGHTTSSGFGLPEDVVRSRLGLLMTRFFNRTDVLCHHAAWGKSCPVYPEADRFETILRSHLDGSDPGPVLWKSERKMRQGQTRGPLRLGSYAPALDGTTCYACFDVDGDTHKARYVKDTLGAALRIMAALLAAGLACHLEKSKSGKGWHVWVFFDRPVPARQIRRVLLALVPRDLPLEGGGFVDPACKGGVELFPKRGDAPRSVGNQVYLPWWHGAKDGGNLFYRETAPGVVEPYEPDDLAAVDEAAFALLVEKAEAEDAAARAAEEEARAKRRNERESSQAVYAGRVDRYGEGEGDDERESESIALLLRKALGKLDATGHRHETTVWLACQLRDNRHDYDDAVDAVRELVRRFPSKDGEDPYDERDALADLDDVWSTARRSPSGRKKKEKSATPTAATGGEGGGKDDNGCPVVKEPKPPPPPPPPITRGPAAPMLFDAGLGDGMVDVECPDSTTLVIIRRDGSPCCVSVRCRSCATCRTARSLDYLIRAEDGIRRDLAAGRRLATFDGEATTGAMKSRLAKAEEYVRHAEGGRWLVVCTLLEGARLPCGFALATPEDAAAVLREMLETEQTGDNPHLESDRRRRAFALSKGWCGSRGGPPKKPERDVSALEGSEEESTNVPPKSRVVAVIPPRSPQAIAEALRRLDLDGGSLALVDATGDDGDESFRRRKARTFFDPRLERNPRPGRRTQWCLPWNPIRPMHLGEILRVSGELAERPREDPEAPSPTAPVKPAPPRRDVDREAEAHRRRVAEMEAFVLASLEKERAGRAAAAAKGGAPC